MEKFVSLGQCLFSHHFVQKNKKLLEKKASVFFAEI